MDFSESAHCWKEMLRIWSIATTHDKCETAIFPERILHVLCCKFVDIPYNFSLETCLAYILFLAVPFSWVLHCSDHFVMVSTTSV